MRGLGKPYSVHLSRKRSNALQLCFKLAFGTYSVLVKYLICTYSVRKQKYSVRGMKSNHGVKMAE